MKELSFWVHSCAPLSSDAYLALVSRWKSGERDLSEDVRAVLLADKLARSNEGTFTPIAIA
ncbi:MAG: hypothetical protein ACRD3Q_01365 [Terriglobales bacterium]